MRVNLWPFLAIAFIGSIAVLPVNSSAARAQSTSPTSQSPARRSTRFSPPADLTGRGRPGNRRGRGAASRSGGAGLNLAEELVALSPKSNIGLTVEEYPTFWFYVPFPDEKFDFIEFALIDGNGQEVYRTRIDAPDAVPGIIHFTLPLSGAPLAANSEYKWFLSILFEDPSEDPDVPRQTVSGWILRALPEDDLVAELAAASSDRDRAAIFAERGIWYTALSELANLYESHPENTSLSEDWKVLLESVGLANLATKPILDCCESSQN